MPISLADTALTISDNAGTTIVDSNTTAITSFEIDWTTVVDNYTMFADRWLQAAGTGQTNLRVWVNGQVIPLDNGGTITVSEPVTGTIQYGISYQQNLGRWITYDELFRGEEPTQPQIPMRDALDPVRRTVGDVQHEVVQAAQVVENPALKRSKELFLSMLTPNQKEQFHTNSFFDIVTNLGNKMRIYSYVSRNIKVIEGVGKGQRLCAHPQGEFYNVPLYDVLLTQKLRLEMDEAAFRKIANASYADY